MSYSWNTEKYIAEVENGIDEGIQEYQRCEFEFITSDIKDAGSKTFIDVGAGYGRILPIIVGHVGRLIAIEQDPGELIELRRRASIHNKAIVIPGSGNNLEAILPSDLGVPVLLSMQNTLGPWVGDREVALNQMRQIAEPRGGEVVVSLFCREALEDWGIPMYATATGVVGNYSPAGSDIAAGDFCTDNGYVSHWFSAEERQAMKQRLGGQVVGEIIDHKFHIFHVQYAQGSITPA